MLPPSILGEISAETGEWNGIPGSVPTTWGWLTPDGDLLSRDEARKLASDAGVPPADPNDVQDTPAATWLEEHGYFDVPLGVTDEMALGWARYDGLIFGMAGLVGIAGAIVLVNRRRPS